MEFTFADEPQAGTEKDDLGHEEQAERVVGVLRRLRSGESSSVVSLVGPWGAGKTSVLNRIQRKLKADESSESAWVTTTFNPWLFSDPESMQMGFITALRSALPIGRRFDQARKAIGGFGATISPLGKITALWGVDSSEIIKKTSKAIASTPDAASAQRRLERELRDLKLPILMVLDDLDRLSPSELLQTFKLVRLVGHLPYVTYLLAYDEETLLDSLSRTELVANRPERATDYMEKMIQVRMDMPPMREQQVSDLFNEAVALLLAAHDLVMPEEEVARLSRAYWALLVDVLHTPRAMKRLFAQVDASVGIAKEGEVALVDLILATYLRTFEPRLYQQLFRLKGSLLPGPTGFSQPKNEQARERWLALLQEAHVRSDRVDGTLALLGEMFPALSARFDNRSLSTTEAEAVAKRKGVGHPDYFDRYFAHVVPAEDLPDSVVRRAIDGPAHSVEEKTVLAALATEPGRVLRKLDTLTSDASDQIRRTRAMQWIGTTYGEMRQDGFLGLAGRREAELFVEGQLAGADHDAGITMLRALDQNLGGLALATLLVARAIRNTSDTVLPWLASGQGWLRVEIPSRLAEIKYEAVSALGPNPELLLHTWDAIDEGAPAAWVRAQIDEGRWTVLELAVALIGTAYGTSGETLGEFEPQKLTRWYPLEEALARLRPLFADGDEIDVWSAKPTPENKARVVLQVMRKVDAEYDGSGTLKPE